MRVNAKPGVLPTEMAESSFLICTLDRPTDLRRTLESLVAQSTLPREVVIVDASDRPSDQEVRSLLEPAGIAVRYLRTEPGRTRQLNMGIRETTGDPVFIVDDDVILDRDFHEAMLRTFDGGGPDIGGVQGTVVDDAYRPLPMRIFRALFLLSRHTKNERGRLLPSGYYTTPVKPSEPRPAEALRLCGLAFRRHVFDEFSFDESFHGYALKEDIDFSYRVSRRYKLLIAPDARFRHLKAPGGGRIGVRAKSKMHVINNYYFFRKNLEGTVAQRMAFAWAMLGRVLYELVRTAAKRDTGYFLGALDGLREIARRARRDRVMGEPE
jgi:GT2 family glycosyltransferase